MGSVLQSWNGWKYSVGTNASSRSRLLVGASLSLPGAIGVCLAMLRAGNFLPKFIAAWISLSLLLPLLAVSARANDKATRDLLAAADRGDVAAAKSAVSAGARIDDASVGFAGADQQPPIVAATQCSSDCSSTGAQIRSPRERTATTSGMPWRFKGASRCCASSSSERWTATDCTRRYVAVTQCLRGTACPVIPSPSRRSSKRAEVTATRPLLMDVLRSKSLGTRVRRRFCATAYRSRMPQECRRTRLKRCTRRASGRAIPTHSPAATPSG